MKSIHKTLVTALFCPLFLMGAPLVEEESSTALVLEENPLTPLDEEISFLAEEFELEEPINTPTEASPLMELVSFSEQKVVPPAPLLMTQPSPILDETAKVQEQPIPSSGTLVVQAPSLVGEPSSLASASVHVDLKQAFRGSPIIYSILFCMSVCAVGLFFYAIGSIQLITKTPASISHQLQNQLMNNHFQEALLFCKEQKILLPQMLCAAIQARSHGFPLIVESMKTEAKRSTVPFWQKISLLNDIAIIAPMLGLLGTVLGMFYAFYDVNRSIESISSLFDGLGVSVGTTVAGLVVAILSLILHSLAKYRLIRALSRVENEAQSLALLLDDKTHIHRG